MVKGKRAKEEIKIRKQNMKYENGKKEGKGRR